MNSDAKLTQKVDNEQKNGKITVEFNENLLVNGIAAIQSLLYEYTANESYDPSVLGYAHEMQKVMMQTFADERY